jgi:Tol biopolymer transport system component
MKRTAAVVVTAMMLLAGCFPILLDVNKDGQVLIPREEGVFSFDLASGKMVRLAERAKGDPAWARWSPDGTKVLVADVAEGGKTALRIVDLKTHAVKPLAELDATACVLWSPDSGSVSAAEVGMGGTQLKLIPLETGQAKGLLSNTLAMHAWLPDGRVLAFRVTEKKENSQVASGELVVVDSAGGEPRIVAQATCDQSAILSVSPDGKQALVVEAEVIGEGDKQQAATKLVQVALADGAKKVLPKADVAAAFWSPDGKRILVLTKGGGDAAGMAKAMGAAMGAPAGGGSQIVVTDAEGKNAVVVATSVLTHSGGMGGPAMYPSWADSDTILYFVSVKTYGEGGTAVRLMSIKVDGSGRKNLQPTIESAVASMEDAAAAAKAATPATSVVPNPAH